MTQAATSLTRAALSQDLIVLPFPLERGKDRYHVHFEARDCRQASDGADYSDGIFSPCSIDGFLVSDVRGRKQVLRYDYGDQALGVPALSNCDYSGFRAIGYLKSPFEQRIAVVNGYGARIQHEFARAYLVIGAHLDVGWVRDPIVRDQ